MFQELEYKYKAENIDLRRFLDFIESVQDRVTHNLSVASWDIYYANPSFTDRFHRYRMGSTPELTYKQKTNPRNNWDRLELDIPLDPTRATVPLIEKYLEMQGYHENFRIFKSCHIYWLENLNFVYYKVFDRPRGTVLGEFIEVEVNKDRVARLGLKEAIKALQEGEKLLGTLGIKPQNRMNRSLFELYRKFDTLGEVKT